MAYFHTFINTLDGWLASAYDEDDVWVQKRAKDSPNDIELVLRPETTPGTYLWLRKKLDEGRGCKPPICAWQIGKSFRREQDQPYKHMRLKEFHQMEFQCLYAADTKNDYHAAMIELVRRMIAEVVGLPTRAIPSDRLPAYSQVTIDIEADTGVNTDGKWLELCSISRRTDFPGTWKLDGKNGPKEIELLVLEIAIGIDRCVFAKEKAVSTMR
jgi:glycyl-tRNA synthetase